MLPRHIAVRNISVNDWYSKMKELGKTKGIESTLTYMHRKMFNTQNTNNDREGLLYRSYGLRVDD